MVGQEEVLPWKDLPLGATGASEGFATEGTLQKTSLEAWVCGYSLSVGEPREVAGDGEERTESPGAPEKGPTLPCEAPAPRAVLQSHILRPEQMPFGTGD